MAIKKAALAKLFVRLKIAEDETKALALIDETEEKDVVIPETIQLFGKDELTTRDRTKYEEGKKAGEEMLIDGLFTEQAIQVAGKKDKATFLSEYEKKVLAGANISVDEKVKEKETMIKQLRENIKNLETETGTFKQQVRQSQLDSDILMWTAEKKPDNLTAKEWVALLKMNNELVEEAGQLFVKRDGKMVQDPKLLTNIPAKDAINSYVDERKLGKVATTTPAGGGGRGGSDSKLPISGITKKSQFEKHLDDNKIHPGGEQAKAMLAQITKDVPDFDFNS